MKQFVGTVYVDNLKLVKEVVYTNDEKQTFRLKIDSNSKATLEMITFIPRASAVLEVHGSNNKVDSRISPDKKT